jgi:hypothetical protein
MSRRISIQSDFQMKQPLLCSVCERRFSQNGENYVVPLLNNGRSFPILDRLNPDLRDIRNNLLNEGFVSGPGV